MATRSTIALENSDGTVSQIYCHWDGYISHHGRILLEHYSDTRKLSNLMELGGLSVLDVDIGVKHDFDNRIDGMCSVYKRDRDQDCPTMKYKSVKRYYKESQQEEFNYLYKKNDSGMYEWWVDVDGGMLLSEAIAKDAECIENE